MYLPQKIFPKDTFKIWNKIFPIENVKSFKQIPKIKINTKSSFI